MAQTEKELDRYYLKRYGVPFAFYEAELARQAGVCKLCGRPPKVRRLHLDHNHKVVRTKIVVAGRIGNFIANVFGRTFCAATRSDAKGLAELYLRRIANRGILCHRCNRGLQYFSDDSTVLRNAANYIDAFNKKIEELVTKDCDADSTKSS